MHLSRRELLRFGVAGSAAVLVGTSAVGSARSPAPRWRGDDPFGLGVASGDPTSDGVVLWTRLAPDPLAPDGRGGMGWDPVSVEYEVADDESFRRVVTRGTALATRELAHSVHPEIRGLEAARWYFYRFRAGSAISPVGRTRTAPAPGQPTPRMRFAFASCQSWSSGYYTAYEQHMSTEGLDLVVHLGDYIYERGWRRGREGMSMGVDAGEAVDLPGYRLRYAQYKAEQPLRDAHAAFPWIVTMDDHEVDNNWAADSPGLGIDIYRIPALFRRRRVAAFQAIYEHQPLRIAQLPAWANMHLHRRYRFGDLMEITMLDTRQYRTPPACGGNVTATAPSGSTPTEQCSAGRNGTGCSTGSPPRPHVGRCSAIRSRWVNSTTIPTRTSSSPPMRGTVRGRAQHRPRCRTDRGVRNLVVITGDRHQHIASDLRRDYADPESPVVASEFVGTSITTGGDGSDTNDAGASLLAANADVRFFNAQRGYVRVDLDQQLWRNDFRVVPFVARPGAPIHTRASFVIQDQVPGVTEAWQPDTSTAPAASPDTAPGHR